VKPSISASGSQLSGNTKKDRIQRPPSSTQKNKVKAHPRIVQSSLKSKNCAVEPKETAIVQHSKLNTNSELICVKYNGCMLSDNHDLCVLNVFNDVNAHPKSKSVKKTSNRKVCKLTGKVVQIVLWYLDSGCSKHMTDDRSQLTNFINKFLSTLKFRNDNVAKTLKTKSWLWHRRLSHLNFGAINHLARHALVRGLPKLKFEKDHLYSACAIIKSKKKPNKPNLKTPTKKNFISCTWIFVAQCVSQVLMERSTFSSLSIITLDLHRTDNGTKFVNQTLREYYKKVGIPYETYVARSPQQNGVVERRNRTLIEATRTMLIYAKALLFLWAEAVATACYTQNRSIIRLRHGKTPYELLHDKLPDLSVFHVFCALCYPKNDSEILEKLQPKADIGYFVILFQPLDELLTPPPSVDPPASEVIAPITEVVAPKPTASIGSPSSTTVDQDAPSPSKPKTYKDALTQARWIEAMQEELNEFEHNPNHVHKLKKDLYGLKQAPLVWYDLLSKFLLSQAFSKGTVDPTLFIRRQGKDILLFKMSMMGKISLGLQISQSLRGIFLNQSKYALESLKKYSMKSSDPVDTPMVEKSKLDEDPQGKVVDPTHYRGMAKPTKKHLHVVKRIFKYLRETVYRGLWYPKDSSIALTTYADAGCQDTRRSTSRSMQLLKEMLVSWSSKKQQSAAISSTKAEYIALSSCCAQVLWMRS
nr:hypothetical protein [Tanacetum cinerariifolium]